MKLAPQLANTDCQHNTILVLLRMLKNAINNSYKSPEKPGLILPIYRQLTAH
ncbi:hypothetical protein YpsIP31758_A0021 (plasmid) [Yersinia pseudotuberculosis IP 31758]|uniref:Uncharacterized protein n=1 Tax=Yersinia pseudotuberculosis serotype O:1b (strain IP 31758) TaxID=349747 RepID=A0A0U1QT87_YERP3|nr:hypothetical protein YpsIP31758_A0021 [Yersinia pseudotuberculosis IP 31758]